MIWHTITLTTIARISYPDSDILMRKSKCLILDPFGLHPAENRHMDNQDLRETVKELSQLDGAFIVLDDGVVPSACP